VALELFATKLSEATKLDEQLTGEEDPLNETWACKDRPKILIRTQTIPFYHCLTFKHPKGGRNPERAEQTGRRDCACSPLPARLINQLPLHSLGAPTCMSIR
jgi:hypothetical protein